MKNPVVSSLVCSATIVPPEQVRAQLERILASSNFTAGKSASRFLRYVVEETLAGRGDQIKEYVVGATVFDRGADYDPRTDAVVRVEATRLRAKLRDYYRSDGSTDPVSIELPKGSYVPVFDSLHTAAPLKRPFRYPSRNTLALALGSVLLIGIALHWVLGRSRADATGNLQAAVAVLPFKNLSGDPSSEYFSDGLAEDLIGALIRIEGLRVPARTSSFAFKGTQHDIREIGQKLGVSSVLEGSAQIIGNRVRVTARLIQVKDGYVVWSQDYERPLRDVYAIQADISRSIVNALRIQLSGPAARALVPPKPNSLEAYSLYLKGRFHSHARAGGWEQDRTAAEYFEQAIQKDPGYVNAYAALASWYTSYQSRELPIQPSHAKAKELAQRALQLDGSCAEAYNALGMVSMRTWDWPGAERQFQRAIELNPVDSAAHLNYSRMLTFEGRFEEALREALRARELDPMPSAVTLQVGQVYYYGSRYPEAMEEFTRMLDAEPGSVSARHSIGTVYAREQLYDQAIAQFQSVKPPDLPVEAGNLRALAHTLAIAGRRREAVEVLAQLRGMSSRMEPGAAGWLDWNVAMVYAGLGDKDKAFEYLTNAYDKGETGLATLRVQPLFDNLRTDPRYTALLEKIGLGNQAIGHGAQGEKRLETVR